MSELRYHPFLDQWVITATHRQDRTFHPPPDFCPLCPTKRGGFSTEIPLEAYDIVVFENRFPSLHPEPPEPAVGGSPLLRTEPAHGACEVVCYSDQHDATLATLPSIQVRKLVRVWKQRYEALSARPEIQYVFIFENKGKEIGVTLTHPHGQIYAYPFIPPVISTELRMQDLHRSKGRCLFDDWLADERADGRRVLFETEAFIAVIPFFARYPYEAHLVATGDVASLAEMGPSLLDDLALSLHRIVKSYDRLFGFSLPYILAVHQQPARGWNGRARFHIELYPPHRSETKLKYLAGSESGAGAFINDTLPEQTAQRLREAASKL